jgi:hypothetical protein
MCVPLRTGDIPDSVDDRLLQILGRRTVAGECIPERGRGPLQVDGLLPARGAGLDVQLDRARVITGRDAERELR